MSYMNRLGNSKNPYQTEAKKVLVLCSAGLLRSPTVANVLHKEYGFNTRAAGVSEEYALIVADDVLLAWADEVVCVHPRVHEDVEERLKKYDARVIVLDLSDKYEWNNSELRALAKKQYDDVLIMEKAYSV